MAKLINTQILVSIATKNDMGAIGFVDQFSDEPVIDVAPYTVSGVEAEIAAYDLVNRVLTSIPEDVESIAISVPSMVFPRLREAQKMFEAGFDAEDAKAKVVKSWLREKDELLTEHIEEAIDNLSRVEIPVLLLKNLNAFRFELDPREAFAAGLKDGQGIDIKDGVATVGKKKIHVLGFKGYTGHVKVSVRGNEFDYKNGAKGINASVPRPEYASEDGEEFSAKGETNDALENWRLLVVEAAKALNRVKKATVRK